MATTTKIIAEIGINHDGEINKAHHMIDLAATSGADIIKFQAVNPDWVYRPDDPLYAIFKKVQFDPDQWRELKRHVDNTGKLFLCTPGEKPSVDMLTKLGVSMFKIASDSAQNIDFVNYVLAKNKPTIVSMGMVARVGQIVDLVTSYQRLPQIVFHCVSQYPTPSPQAGLGKIKQLIKRLPLTIGYSDHVTGYAADLIAVSYGAKFIEKHVKLADSDIDAPVSLNFDDFGRMVNLIREMEALL